MARTDGSEPQFERVGRTTLVAEVAQAVLEMIHKGELKPGDRLPSERALSQQLGVSRPTVRASVSSLVAMNVLEVQHGSGTYVSSLDAKELLRSLPAALSVFEADHDELFAVRLMLEPPAAALAAQRIGEEKLRELAAARNSAQDTEDVDRFIKWDIDLHRMIMEASGNVLLQRLMAALSALGAASRNQTARWPDDRERAAREHFAVMDAVLDRDPDAASEAMREHLIQSREAAREPRT